MMNTKTKDESRIDTYTRYTATRRCCVIQGTAYLAQGGLVWQSHYFDKLFPLQSQSG